MSGKLMLIFLKKCSEFSLFSFFFSFIFQLIQMRIFAKKSIRQKGNHKIAKLTFPDGSKYLPISSRTQNGLLNVRSKVFTVPEVLNLLTYVGL